jgi:hypothetical protein
MAYKVITSEGIYIQYTLMDFIEGVTWELVDYRTQEGMERFKEISKPRVSKRKNANGSAGGSASSSQDVRFLAKRIFNERDRRLFAGFLARVCGIGGIQTASKVTGLDEKTVRRGMGELLKREGFHNSRIRREGGGRSAMSQVEPLFERELLTLVEDELAGDPMSQRKWVRKTLRWMKKQLRKKGINASISTIRKTLKMHGISLKKNKKSKSLQDHPMRDTQFRYLNKMKRMFLDLGKPNISVDAKKKEKIGNFKNDGRVWRRKSIEVLDHDFANLAVGKFVPFGIYDLKNNKGQVYCGTSFETSEFAVDCICRWWEEYGQEQYPNQFEILVLCDSGGSNGYRRRAWKWELQTKLADRFGLIVHVCHYPPGASKYNPIERKLFSFISKNWAGEPLISYEKALSFIRSTSTENGLEVGAALIEKEYEKGLMVNNEQMGSLNIKHAKICPQWNYCIRPR